MLQQILASLGWVSTIMLLSLSTGSIAQDMSAMKNMASMPNMQKVNENNTNTNAAMSMDHSHMPIEIPEEIATPALSLSIYQDTVSGYNLELSIERYSLIPPPADLTTMEELMVPTINKNSGFVEGHAHLYVNGEKIQRIYGNYIHLPATLFKPGINQLTVSINNHGHMYWTFEKRQILATLFINPSSESLITYQFESFPVGL